MCICMLAYRKHSKQWRAHTRDPRVYRSIYTTHIHMGNTLYMMMWGDVAISTVANQSDDANRVHFVVACARAVRCGATEF